MTSGDITFRPATSDDVDRVFEWANDPVTRAASFTTDPIPYADHVAWFGASLDRADRHLLMALRGGSAVAFVRFDGVGPQATISINVAPDSRGKGLGTAALTAASDEAARLGYGSILAFIRPENTASVKAFSRAGYAPQPEGAVGGQRALRYIKAL